MATQDEQVRKSTPTRLGKAGGSSRDGVEVAGKTEAELTVLEH